MASGKNLLYGSGEGRFGERGPNLETLATVAKLGLTNALEEAGHKIGIKELVNDDPDNPKYSGFLDDFSYKDKNSLDSYSFTLSQNIGICTYTLDAGARLDYDLNLNTKGLLKSVILPLVDGIEYLSNSTSQPDGDGKAVETIKYKVDSNLNLSKLKSDLTLAGNGLLGVSLTGSNRWCRDIPIGPNFNLPAKTYPIELPSSHPFSLDLTLELPSFDNLKSSKEKNGIIYSKNPKPTKIEISNLKTNGLYNKALDSVAPVIKSTVGSIIYNSLGFWGTAIGIIPGARQKIGDFMGGSIVDVMRSTFANRMVSKMEEDLQEGFLIESPVVDEEGNVEDTSLLDSFKDEFADTVVDFAWNDKEYPRRNLKTININAIHGFKKSDELLGTKRKDIILAGDGSDVLDGRKGNDILIGGKGGDIKSGGKGADTFAYLKLNDSVPRKGKIDLITDFSSTEDDKIDLSEIYNGLSFIGTEEFSRAPGEIRFEDGILELSLNKKGTSAFSISLLGVNSINESDLIL